ncbi:MAG: phytanoyl-CoA dioxygenase family protein [Novosphingobium sp.]
MIIEDAKARLHTEGWCIVPDIISKGAAADALARLWAIARANAEEGYSCFLPGLDPTADMVRVLTPLQSDGVFRELIQNETALELACAVVGQEVIVANCTGNIAMPGAKSMALHSDLAFILPEPWIFSWSVNVVWCLTDVHRDNGATLYIPGSHNWRTSADIPQNAQDLLVPFEAPAGSIVVMDGRLWHTSGNNVTANEERALLFSYYCASFMRPMINWSAAIPPDLQSGFPPRLRQLLCLDVFANTFENELEGQGHWKGQPVGREKAVAQFRQAADRRAKLLA